MRLFKNEDTQVVKRQISRIDCISAFLSLISKTNQMTSLDPDIVQTHHHGLQLHTVGWNAAAAVLERLLQVLLTRFSDACQNQFGPLQGRRAQQRFHHSGV